MAQQEGLIRADGAGYSHALITALSTQGLEFSVGYPVTEAVRDAIKLRLDRGEQRRRWTAGARRRRGGDRHARPEPVDRDLPGDAGHRPP